MNLKEMLSIGNIPTISPNIAFTTLFKRKKKRRAKIATSCYFLTGMHFNLLSMQKDVKCPRIF